MENIWFGFIFCLHIVQLCASETFQSNVTQQTSKIEFGHEMLREFMLSEGFINMNHGSFGSIPKVILDAQTEYQRQCEANPDVWMRGGYQRQLEQVREKMASYLNAEGRDLVFVENTSSGINAILRSLPFKTGDIIVDFSVAYGMVKNTLTFLRGFEGVVVDEIPVVFRGKGTPPVGVNGQSLEEALEETLDKYGNAVQLVVFSHIVSAPGIIMPVKKLAQVCQKRSVPVLVDGAHALGQIPVDLTMLQEAGVAAWIGNAHKWLYSPKGSAVLWISRTQHFQGHNLQDIIVPTVVSSAFREGVIDRHNGYLNAFQYTGTRDYTPFVTIANSMDFRNEQCGGDDEIWNWNHKLAIWAEKYLSELWNTEILVPESMTAFMAHVRIPTTNETIGSKLQSRLLNEYDIETTVLKLENPVHTLTGNETILTEPTFWFRLSCQIYLEESDFYALGDAVKNILNL